jgi:predicted nucleic acid-binding protein
MNKYLLDTNIPLYLEDPESPFHHSVKGSFQKLQDEDQLFISVLSLFELYYGVELKKKEGKEQLAAQTLRVIEEIKKKFTLLPLNGKEASVFGKIKTRYKVRSRKKDEKKETIKKHDIDFILASTAIKDHLIIVSNDSLFRNIKELYPTLQVENWTRIEHIEKQGIDDGETKK